MKAYILSIAGAVLLSAVVSIVAPNGKMGKFVKGGLKLVVLVVLVTPFVSFFVKGDFPLFIGQADLTADEEYLAVCGDMREEADGRAVLALIEEEYAVEATVCVEYQDGSFSARKKIAIKIIDFGIYPEDEHIDIMQNVAERVRRVYGCEVQVS